MSFENHMISETDVSMSDIRDALIDTTSVNGERILSGSLKASELFDPRIVVINKWSKFKPTDVAQTIKSDRHKGKSGDFSLNLVKSTTASGINSDFDSSWNYKFRDDHHKIGDFAGYYSQAQCWARTLTFPSEIKKRTAYTNKISIYIVGDADDDTVRWQDITKTTSGTSIDLGDMYPGYILYSSSKYYLKCTSKKISASDGTTQIYTMNMTSSATNGMTTGTYILYPVLFEGTPSSAMTGTGAGATSKPSSITGMIPLPFSSRSVSVVGSSTTTTPYVTYNRLFVERYGSRAAFRVMLTLSNTSTSVVNSWQLKNVSATDGSTTESLGTITISESVAAGSSASIEYTISSNLSYSNDTTYSLTINGVTRSASPGVPERE